MWTTEVYWRDDVDLMPRPWHLWSFQAGEQGTEGHEHELKSDHASESEKFSNTGAL